MILCIIIVTVQPDGANISHYRYHGMNDNIYNFRKLNNFITCPTTLQLRYCFYN